MLHMTTSMAAAAAANSKVHVRDVWECNLEQEFSLIRNAIKRFPYASMDTEFPGIVVPPLLDHNRRKISYQAFTPDQAYQIMKDNVNATKLIQLGLTLSDANGDLPTDLLGCGMIWQFNFREFDIDKDNQNPDSIELLKGQAGIDFLKNRDKGIDSKHFARLFLASGLCLVRRVPPGFAFPMTVTWVTFHSAYDFGYLVKVLTQRDLPEDRNKFMVDVARFFGVVYDIKHMIKAKYCGLYGGLEKIAKSLCVDRVAGKSHQAGSDSLLTMQTFLKLKDKYFCGVELDEFNRKLYGLEVM